MVEPSSMNNVTVYVRNEGDVAASISLSTENWNLSNASDYLTLSWNYDGRPLNPLDVVQVTLTLTVSSSVQRITSSSFDTIISASDQNLSKFTDDDRRLIYSILLSIYKNG